MSPACLCLLFSLQKSLKTTRCLLLQSQGTNSTHSLNSLARLQSSSCKMDKQRSLLTSYRCQLRIFCQAWTLKRTEFTLLFQVAAHPPVWFSVKLQTKPYRCIPSGTFRNMRAQRKKRYLVGRALAPPTPRGKKSPQDKLSKLIRYEMSKDPRDTLSGMIRLGSNDPSCNPHTCCPKDTVPPGRGALHS